MNSILETFLESLAAAIVLVFLVPIILAIGVGVLFGFVHLITWAEAGDSLRWVVAFLVFVNAFALALSIEA
jgi:hypothetical protein